MTQCLPRSLCIVGWPLYADTSHFDTPRFSRHRVAWINRVLVTGARGFLGRPIANLLAERGWDVVRTATTPCKEHVVVDLLDDTAVLALVRKVEPTHLVHAAWKSVHGDVMHSTDNLAWLRSSLGLLKCFREAGGRRAAALGTSAEYDWTSGVCCNGVTPLRPTTLYGACKHALHVALEAYAGASGLEFVWPRVFSVYGPGEHEVTSRAVGDSRPPSG